MMIYKMKPIKGTVQTENAFLLYDAIRVWFRKCRLKSDTVYRKLKIDAAQMNDETRENRANRIGDQVDRFLVPLEDRLSGMRCESSLWKKNGNFLMYFATGFEDIAAVVYPDGRCEMRIFENGKCMSCWFF